MCIIIAAPPGRFPKYDNIIDATWENPDGSGWVIQTPNGLEINRSARSIDSMVGSFWECRKEYPNGWAIWHSRLATQGGINDVNTHPFQVPGRPWALVHNGVLPLSDGPFRDDRSDSRILAEDHISGMSWRGLRKRQEAIENWLGHDKVILISGVQEKGGNVIIFNEDVGTWEEEDSCWYSHPLYGYPFRRHVGPIVAKALDADIDWEEQDMSDAIIAQHEEYETFVDGNGNLACIYCSEALVECLCYDPDEYTDAWTEGDEWQLMDRLSRIDRGEWSEDDEAAYRELFDNIDAHGYDRAKEMAEAERIFGAAQPTHGEVMDRLLKEGAF